jgi:hypothetical protein
VRVVWYAVVAGCAGDGIEGEEGPPVCDGRLQASEGVVLDSTFDRDGDGWVDGEEPDCIETYDLSALDCDDDNPQQFPGAPERTCNGIDDDCNPDTPDALDNDSDGVIACDDCDDTNGGMAPGRSEVCWDGIDNNCDGQIDPGCGIDYNGSFVLDQEIRYRCEVTQIPLAEVAFTAVDVLWIPPNAAFVSSGSSQPGTLNGVIEDDGTLLMEGSTSLGTGLCDIYYRWEGSFADADHFTADFTVQIEGFFCNNCSDVTFPGVSGARASYQP